MKATNYLGDCTGLPARMIETLDDRSIDITYRTFLKRVGWDVVKEINQNIGGVPTIKNDWAVSFHRSKWKNRFVYIMMHSGIHHVWSM